MFVNRFRMDNNNNTTPSTTTPVSATQSIPLNIQPPLTITFLLEPIDEPSTSTSNLPPPLSPLPLASTPARLASTPARFASTPASLSPTLPSPQSTSGVHRLCKHSNRLC